MSVFLAGLLLLTAADISFAQLVPPSTSKSPLSVNFTGFDGDTATALNGLRQEIAALLPTTYYKRMTPSCKVVLFASDNSLIPIHEVNPNLPVFPASVEKLFTTSAILWALGSKFEFTTDLNIAPGGRIEGTAVVGNIYLRPSGDPTLSGRDFDDLASKIKALGVSQIEGDIVSDLSSDDILSPDAKKYFAEENKKFEQPHSKDSLLIGDNGIVEEADTTVADPGDESHDEEEMAGFFSNSPNFFIDRNTITIHVTGGSKKGAPVNVSVYPPIPSVKIINRGGTSAPARTTKKRVKVGRGRKARHRTITIHSRSTYTLHISISGTPNDAHQVVTISGLIPARTARNYAIPIRNVPLAMAGLLKWRLEQNGIKVVGVARTGSPPNTKKELYTFAQKSTFLLDLLQQTNKRSDNFLAESMFRKLATARDMPTMHPLERSKKMMNSWMKVLGVNMEGCEFADGCGLSRNNYVTANSVIALLHGIRERKEMYNDFLSTMSIAGVDGTTRGRMIGTPAWGNAHSKTGTLNGVTALSGYVATKDNQLAAYFITMQNFGGGAAKYKYIQDAIVTKLASFGYADYIAKYSTEPKPDPVTAPGE